MTRLVTLPVCCRVSGTVRCQCSPLQDLDSTVYTGTFSAPPCSFSICTAPSACVNHAETAPWIVCSLWTLCSVDLCSRWIVFSPWILCSVDLCFLWIVYSLWILWSVDLCSLWILSSVVCVCGLHDQVCLLLQVRHGALLGKLFVRTFRNPRRPDNSCLPCAWEINDSVLNFVNS